MLECAPNAVGFQPASDQLAADISAAMGEQNVSIQSSVCGESITLTAVIMRATRELAGESGQFEFVPVVLVERAILPFDLSQGDIVTDQHGQRYRIDRQEILDSLIHASLIRE